MGSSRKFLWSKFPAAKEKSTAPMSFEYDVDWRVYLDVRPRYPASIYERICDYHAENATSPGRPRFKRAIDVGAGPGVFSKKLSSYFETVVVNESNRDHIQQAMARLEDSQESFEYLVCRAEDLTDAEGYGTADLIVVANTINFLDVESALDCFSKVLRPGGTLAISQYASLPFFSDFQPSVVRNPRLGLDVMKAQARLEDLAVTALSLRMRETYDIAEENGGRPLVQEAKDRFALLYHRLDGIKLSRNKWKAVQRLHWFPEKETLPIEGFAEDHTPASETGIPDLDSQVRREETVISLNEELLVKELDSRQVEDYITMEAALSDGRRQWARELASVKEEMSVINWRMVFPYDVILATRR